MSKQCVRNTDSKSFTYLKGGNTMNFQLTEDRLALQQAVREFAEKELAPGVIERDEKSEYPVELYKKMGEMGLIGLPYAKEYGGSGRDYLDYAIAVEEISKVDASVGISYSVSTSLYGGSIANGGSRRAEKRISFRKFSPERPLAPSDLPSLTPVPMQAAVLLLQKRKATNTY